MLRHFFYDNVCEVVVEMAEPQKNQEDGTKLCVISKYHEDFFFFFFEKKIWEYAPINGRVGGHS